MAGLENIFKTIKSLFKWDSVEYEAIKIKWLNRNNILSRRSAVRAFFFYYCSVYPVTQHRVTGAFPQSSIKEFPVSRPQRRIKLLIADVMWQKYPTTPLTGLNSDSWTVPCNSVIKQLHQWQRIRGYTMNKSLRFSFFLASISFFVTVHWTLYSVSLTLLWIKTDLIFFLICCP